MNPIRVTQEVFNDLNKCRESAECNMFDVLCVKRWLDRHGYHSTVVWVDAHKDKLFDGCIVGFEVMK